MTPAETAVVSADATPRVRSRKWLLAVPVVAVAAVFLAYLLFGWFGFEPLLRWALPKAVAERSGHLLSVTRARFDPLRLSVDVQGLALNEPDGKPLLALSRVYVDFDATSLFEGAYVFDHVQLSEPVLQLELRADGRLNWQRLVDAYAGTHAPQDAADTALPRLLLRRAVLERGHIEFVDRQVAGGFQSRVEPLDVDLQNLSTLPEDTGGHTLTARTGAGTRVRWQGKLGLSPLRASGEVAVDELHLSRLWPYLKAQLNMAPPGGDAALSFTYRASYADRAFKLDLERLSGRIDRLVLRGADAAAPAIALDTVHIDGGRVDFTRREAVLEAVRIEGGRVAVGLDEQGRPDLAAWLAPASRAASAADPASPAKTSEAAASPWRFGVGQVGVDKLALHYADRGYGAPLRADVDSLKVGFGARGQFGAGEPQVDITGLAAELTGLRLSSRSIDKPWFELARLTVDDGRLALPGRDVSLGRVVASGGSAWAVRQSGGRLPLLEALRRSSAAPPPAARGNAAPADWRYRVGRVEASDFALALRDESVTPALNLKFDAIRAEATGLSQDLAAAVPVRLQLRVKSGGRLEAHGKVVPAAPAADLQLTLSNLSLLPAQAHVARYTTLALVGGQAGTQGRLRHGPKQTRYDGGLVLTDLLLNHAATGERFLGWRSLRTSRLAATPQQVQVGEVVLDGLDAEFIVFKDRTVNVAGILKPAAGGATPATPKAAAASPPLRVDVERVRFVDGRMDFADLSLALPFAARIHKLGGQLVGLSSLPGNAAQLELEGQVDDYGLARAAGQINLFDAAAYTDLQVVFRNVEMTTLTPYSATFAGRKIESGKLSLDLDYKIKDRQLHGENQIVMDQLTLGERVQSPTARDLPLDLAIAILKDANGRIDLGLPVSGSLDHPQFSYGAIVWKAIVNVVTRIVTAPFRALGALFGGGGDTVLDKVNFEPGHAELLPPEREKLVKLAALMAQRPGLAVSLRGTFDPGADRQALGELQLRRALAAAGGRQLDAGDDPGPISTAQPATREALEKLFVRHFGDAALASLTQRHRQANPGPQPDSAAGRLLSRFASALKTPPPPLSADEQARLRGADVHTLMLQRLLDAQVVDDAALLALAGTRAESTRSELVARQLAAHRVRVDEPEPRSAEQGVVPVTLGLAAAGAAASSAAPASTPVPAR